MAVAFGASQNLGGGRWLVAWSSTLGSPPPDGYRIFKSGVLVAQTDQESWQFTLAPGEQLVLEVLDDADQEPESAFPGTLLLGWRRTANTQEYRVEEYVGGLWVERRTVPDNGREWYSFESRFLEDVTTHQFRVIPVGTNGNDGTAISFSALMVRHPDQPIEDSELNERFTYSEDDKTVTIAV